MLEAPSVRQALARASDLLSQAGVGEPGRDALVLLGHATGEDPHLLIAEGGFLEGSRLSRFLELVRTRANRTPLQYVLGTQEFMSLEMIVDERVLIPRPETEVLVGEALKLVKTLTSPIVVDVGTGSGAIAVSIAYYCRDAEVYGIDISPDALEVARINANRHGVPLNLLQGNLLEPLGVLVDIIVANLPYVRDDEMAGLEPELSREPRLALAGGPDGLDITRSLVEQTPSHLRSGGALLLEVDPGQVGYLTDALHRKGFRVRIVPDYTGRERVLAARRT